MKIRDEWNKTDNGVIEITNDHDHISGNLWQGAIPVHGLDSKFKYSVNLAGGGYRLHNPTWQQVIVAPFEDSTKIPPKQFLHGIADLVIKLIDDGPTLVHCHAGLNRSGIICALVLIKQGMSPDDAIELLRSKRDRHVLCNDDFRDWLYIDAGT